MVALVINNRGEPAQWAVERANAIIVEHVSTLATAARSDDKAELAISANALGLAIVDSLLGTLGCRVDNE